MSNIQKLAGEALERIQPYLGTAGTVFRKSVAVPFQQYVNTPFLVPLANAAVTQLAPVLPFIESAQSALPSFKGYPVNYVGIGVIVLHVVFYNLIAQIEFRSKIFTKVSLFLV